MPPHSAAAQGPWSRWCPPEITDAAVPLSSAGRVLKGLSEDHKGVARLADSSPTPAVRAALHDFVERWTLVLYAVSGTSHSLATNLRWAAEDYQGTEAQVVHDFLVAPRASR